MAQASWLALPWLLGVAAAAAQAGTPGLCERQAEPSAAEQDRLIRFGAIIKEELERSGQRLALIARSGLDLQRLGQRYSHAGLSLRASANGPWSVRQLYYACDEARPRLFDQGMSGFLMGTSDPRLGYVSLLLLPGEAAAALERSALDDRRALQLLGGRYSANAHAFGLRYQNCNQWLAELLALAWAAPMGGGDGADGGGGAVKSRAQAQQWLREQGYEPSRIEAGGWLGLAYFIPWLRHDDHPDEDLLAGRYQVSMPESLERFVRAQVPGASRIELCHGERGVVIRRGWQPLAEGCRAEAGDELIAL